MVKGMRILVVVAAVVAAQGCATIPRESVELSASLATQLDDMHQKHVALLNRYFDDVADRWRHVILTDYKDSMVKRARAKLKEKGRDLTVEDYDKIVTRVLSKQDEMLGQVQHERSVALAAVLERYALMQREVSGLHGLLKSASDLRQSVQKAVETAEAQAKVIPGFDALDEKLKGYAGELLPKDLIDNTRPDEVEAPNVQPKR